MRSPGITSDTSHVPAPTRESCEAYASFAPTPDAGPDTSSFIFGSWLISAFQSLNRVKLPIRSVTVDIGRFVSTSCDTERFEGRNTPITMNTATTINREINHSITRVIRKLSRNGPRRDPFARPQERVRIAEPPPGPAGGAAGEFAAA